ncbi:MAG: hypothetical protein ACE145_07025 [Terriglobia bacterium]
MSAFLVLVIPSYVSEPKRHHRADTELGIHEETAAGCFLTGHPQVKEPIGSAVLGFGEERVFLFGAGAMPLGSVSYRSIVGVAVESHEVVLVRFSQERMMRLGHHFLAFRSRETADGSYVVVEWLDDKGERHDGIFCFEGLAADARARALRDAILHHAALHRRAFAAHVHESLGALLDEFETRKCGHCDKIHRHSAEAGHRSVA